MSEPKVAGNKVNLIDSSLWHWSTFDDRIRFRSDAYLFVGDSPVLVDPLPLTPSAWGRLPKPTAILMTVRAHQRSSWRMRDRWGIPVYAPECGAPQCEIGLDESPDHTFRDGDRLPGGLLAIRTPGPLGEHYALLSQSKVASGENKKSIALVGDLLLEGENGEPEILPKEHVQSHALVLESLKALVSQGPYWLCCAHGPPWDEGETRLRAIVSRYESEESSESRAKKPG